MTRPHDHDPRCHLRPPSGWLNDPNGPFRWRGRYHLFYQYNPAAPVHADIHWGHASSADLVHWHHHPVALAPIPGGPDADGCWSGCVLDDVGTPTAVYTGVAAPPGIDLGTVCLAHAETADERLVRWRQLPSPVVEGPPDELDVAVFRDPFVFRHGGRRWALVGAGHTDGTPSVLLYDCEDLKAWRFAGVLLDGGDPVAARAGADARAATAWECPQLFPATGAEEDGGDWVLVLSLHDGDPRSVAYLTGTLAPVSGGGLAFTPRLGGRVDHGRDWYAPAVLREEGRVLMWGWSWESRPRREIDAAGWAGLLTFPREVSTHPDGTLRSVPAPELASLRGPEPFVERAAAGPEPLGPLPLPGAYELHVTAEGGPAVVELLRGPDGASLTLRLAPGDGRVVLDRSGWPRERDGSPADSGPLVLPVPLAGGEPLAVRVLVDGSVVEVFAGEGHATATERVYRRPGDTARLTARGTAPGSVFRVTGWELALRMSGGPPGTAAA